MPPTMPETAAQPIRLTALPTEQAAGFRAAARAVVEQQAPAAGVEQQRLRLRPRLQRGRGSASPCRPEARTRRCWSSPARR